MDVSSYTKRIDAMLARGYRRRALSASIYLLQQNAYNRDAVAFAVQTISRIIDEQYANDICDEFSLQPCEIMDRFEQGRPPKSSCVRPTKCARRFADETTLSLPCDVWGIVLRQCTLQTRRHLASASRDLRAADRAAWLSEQTAMLTPGDATFQDLVYLSACGARRLCNGVECLEFDERRRRHDLQDRRLIVMNGILADGPVLQTWSKDERELLFRLYAISKSAKMSTFRRIDALHKLRRFRHDVTTLPLPLNSSRTACLVLEALPWSYVRRQSQSQRLAP